MTNLKLVVLTIIVTLLISKTVASQDQVWYSKETVDWTAAGNGCGNKGSFAGESVENIENILEDFQLDEPVWINGYAILSPWYGYDGCYSFNSNKTAANKMNDITPAKCITHCGKNYDIGIQGTNCYCFRKNGQEDVKVTDLSLCAEDKIGVFNVLNFYILFKNVYPSSKIPEKFNKSCLTTTPYTFSRNIDVENCEDLYRYVCKNGSGVYNHTSWIKAQSGCQLRNSTLSININENSLSSCNDVVWTGFRRDEELVWGKDLSERDKDLHRCLAVMKYDNQTNFIFRFCNESLHYLCTVDRQTNLKDQTQSEQTTSATNTTINGTDSIDRKSTVPNLENNYGSCVAVVVVVVIILVFVGVYIVRKKRVHSNKPETVNQGASENYTLNSQYQVDRIQNRISIGEYHYVCQSQSITQKDNTQNTNSTEQYNYICPPNLHKAENDSHLYDHSFMNKENNDYDVTTTLLKKQEIRADDTYDHTPRSHVPNGSSQKMINDATYDHI